MTVNMGTIDRVLRAVLSLVLLYLAFLSGLPLFEGAVMTYGAALVGLVMLVTAAVRICPLYSIIGINTCRS